MDNTAYSILVVGGAGYIGSHLTLGLCDIGHHVTVFDNLSTGNKANIDNRANFFLGDILNEKDLENLFNNHFDIVFHFAGLKAARDSMDDLGTYANSNIVGTINILRHMEKRGISKIIFSSSAAVYGEPKYLPLDEKHPLEPVNFYGFTKLEIERLLDWFKKLSGIDYSILRYFNAAGYDINKRIKIVEKNPKNLIPIIMETLLGTRDLVYVFGDDYNTPDGTCIRDYIHVSDLVSAHIKSMYYIIDNQVSITLNLSSGVGYSVLDVINKVQDIVGKKIQYKIVKRRPGDLEKLVSGATLAKKMINWKLKYSKLDQIIESTWNICR